MRSEWRREVTYCPPVLLPDLLECGRGCQASLQWRPNGHEQFNGRRLRTSPLQSTARQNEGAKQPGAERRHKHRGTWEWWEWWFTRSDEKFYCVAVHNYWTGKHAGDSGWVWIQTPTEWLGCVSLDAEANLHFHKGLVNRERNLGVKGRVQIT